MVILRGSFRVGVRMLRGKIPPIQPHGQNVGESDFVLLGMVKYRYPGFYS